MINAQVSYTTSRPLHARSLARSALFRSAHLVVVLVANKWLRVRVFPSIAVSGSSVQSVCMFARTQVVDCSVSSFSLWLFCWLCEVARSPI